MPLSIKIGFKVRGEKIKNPTLTPSVFLPKCGIQNKKQQTTKILPKMMFAL